MGSIFDVNQNLRMAVLNAPGLPHASSPLTGSGPQHVQLEIGKSYRFQPVGGDVYLGWGKDSTTADNNSATTVGELLSVDADPRQFTVLSASAQWLSRTPASGTTDLRFWEIQTP